MNALRRLIGLGALGGGLHADTLAWIGRASAAGAAPSSQQVYAVNRFIKTIRAAISDPTQWRMECYAFGNAVLNSIPLYAGGYSSSSTFVNFTGGEHTQYGITLSGSKAIQTPWIPSARGIANASSIHVMTAKGPIDNPANCALIGARNGTSSFFQILYSQTTSRMLCRIGRNDDNEVNSTHPFYGQATYALRNGSPNGYISGFTEGAATAFANFPQGRAQPNVPVSVGAVNIDGVLSEHAAGTYLGVMLGQTIADPQPSLSLYNAWETLIGDLGAESRVRVFGDSLAWGATEGTPWDVQWLTGTGMRSRNKAIAATPSSDTVSRILSDSLHNRRRTVIWTGHNSFGGASERANIAACAAACAGNYLVIELLPINSSNGTYDTGTGLRTQLNNFNDALASDHGTKFVRVISSLLAAGDGGANDNSDIARGCIPRSLRKAGDGIHLNSAGNAVIAARVAAVAALNGWSA